MRCSPGQGHSLAMSCLIATVCQPLNSTTSAVPHLLPTTTNQEACYVVTNQTTTKPEATQIQHTVPQAVSTPPPLPHAAAVCYNLVQPLIAVGWQANTSLLSMLCGGLQAAPCSGTRTRGVCLSAPRRAQGWIPSAAALLIPQWTAVYVGLRQQPPAVAGITAAASKGCCCWICCCCWTGRGVVQLPLLVPRILFADYVELSPPSGGEAVLADAFYCFLHFHFRSVSLPANQSRQEERGRAQC